MQKDPLKDDPTSQWPEEIRRAYEHLEVPSLYDFIVANEKLSSEVHKQTQEMKTIGTGLERLSSQLDMFIQTLTEELGLKEYEGGIGSESRFEEDTLEEGEMIELTDLEAVLLQEREERIEKSSRELLMETSDALLDLSKKTKQLTNQLINILPKNGDLSTSISGWYQLSEDLIQSLIEHVNTARYKILARLEERDIQVIEPLPGDSFNSQRHRVVEQTKGGKPGTIARVIRAGYMQKNKLLRSAEVVVYI